MLADGADGADGPDGAGVCVVVGSLAGSDCRNGVAAGVDPSWLHPTRAIEIKPNTTTGRARRITVSVWQLGVISDHERFEISSEGDYSSEAGPFGAMSQRVDSAARDLDDGGVLVDR